jgi:hypothetical protein
MKAHSATEPTIENIGVDYLTATAYRPGPGHLFKDLGTHLIEQSALIGNDVRPFRASDYRGYQSGGVCVGTRHDTHIIRLSSDEARDNWRDVYKLATNVSRIDLQLTFKLDSPHEPFIREQHAQAIRAKQGQGRKREIELKWNSVKGDTLYIGNRSSDVFARVYDKGRQEKSELPGLLIRHEIEYKRKTAMSIADSLDRAESVNTHLARLVSTYLRRFDLQTLSAGEANVQCARGRTTDNEVKRRWLLNSVKPSVTRLVEAGMLSEVLDALGIGHHVTINTNTNEEE